MKIAVNKFMGQRPALAPHLLPANAAQVAENCKFVGGDLRSFRAPGRVTALDINPALSIFEYSENGNTHWVASANDVDAVASPAANDAFERMFFTGESEPRFFANDNISTPFDPQSDYFKSGIPAPVSAPTVSRTGPLGTDYRAYLYNYLNRYGDPGSNSPIGEIADYDSGRILLTGIDSPPADHAIDRIWVYRTNASDVDTSAMQFVLEAFFFDTSVNYAVGEFVVYGGEVHECTAPHIGVWDPAHFTPGEAVAAADLGEAFAFSNYYPAPDGARGLMALPSGVCACFFGNTLYMSEPGKPYVFPYQKSFKYEIVGVAKLGTSIVVLTTGKPFRVYGQHPAAMAVYEYGDFMPCEAKRTVAEGQGLVCYRSMDGLAAVNAERVWLITAADGELAPVIDADSWQSADYAPLHGHFVGDLYFGFSNSAAFYIDVRRRYCAKLGVVAQAGYLSETLKGLCIVVAEGDTAYVKLWEGDDQNYMAYTWRGRLELTNYHTALAMATVVLDADFLAAVADTVDLQALNAVIFAGDINGALRDKTLRDVTLRGDDMYALSGFAINDTVSFKLYVDGVLKATRLFSDVVNTFTLPSGWLSRRLELEVSGYVTAARMVAASSFEEGMGIGG